ncbi:hypothetical protein HHI36_013933 [Cryptolaemus montrouzieri]|uniref:Uncharacterized protein n=1 Tax=Cryptolaemus montrouzieri TaxID=559131 RepID=A0ABD2N174_9CUCU
MEDNDGNPKEENKTENNVRPKRFRNLASVSSMSSENLDAIVKCSDDKLLMSSVRRRVQITTEKIETGSLNILSAKYESLDYDTCENYLF